MNYYQSSMYNAKDLEEDYTRELFEKFNREFVINEIPKMLSTLDKENYCRQEIRFMIRFWNDKNFLFFENGAVPEFSIFAVDAGQYILSDSGAISEDDFIRYFEQIKNIKAVDKYKGIGNALGTRYLSVYVYEISIKDLIDYYYEELQCMEYEEAPRKLR